MKHLISRLLLIAIFIHTEALSIRAATVQFADQTLTVPEGFVVERIAGPPLVERPIEADFDEAGRLYVTDSSGSNEPVKKQLLDKPHRVIRLEDSDGDGRFDKRTVFADKLMFPQGCLWFDGSLYVSAAPSIWKLTDTDGDGVADRREEWHRGKTLTGCANDLHGPYLGPDGWIYWSKGAFAEQTYVLSDGTHFKSRAAHLFRKRPDGSAMDVVMTGGMDNPVGVAFTPGGERIFSTTFFQHPAGGQRDGLIHAIYGGLYGKRHSVLDGHRKTGDLMPVMTHLGAAAPCGLVRYESRVFGQDYQDDLFACLFNMHKVTRHHLIPSGASFRTVDSDFVISDSTDFHPTDVLEDADGSLIIVDTGGWYKLCCPTSQLAKPDVLGGIYRVRREGSSRVGDPRGDSIPWSRQTPARLVEHLADVRPAVQRRAIQELVERGSEAVATLAQQLKQSSVMDVRRLSIWALTRIEGEAARRAVRIGLGDSDETVRQAAIHSVGVWRDAAAASALEDILKGKSDPNIRAAAEVLGRIGSRRSVPSLFAAVTAERLQDRALDHSLLYALMEIADVEQTRSFLGSTDPFVRRAALIVMDQLAGRWPESEALLSAGEVAPLLGGRNKVLRETASWVVGHHPEWGESLAGVFRERLAAGKLTAAAREELRLQLAQHSRGPAVQQLMVSALGHDGGSNEMRRLVLRAMAGAGLKPAPAAWLDAVTVVLAEHDAGIVKEAVATAGALMLPKGGHAGLSNALIQVGRELKLGSETRLAALASIRGGLRVVEPDQFELLVAHLGPSTSVSSRGAAVRALTGAKLNRDQLWALAGLLPRIGPLELPKVLVLFERGGDEAMGMRLVSVLGDSLNSGLRAEQVKRVLDRYPPTVQERGEDLMHRLNADAAKQQAHLEELIKEIHEVGGGEVRRGQGVFNSAKAACSACHAIGYLGGRLGPDLTHIGRVRTERDLLEAIIYPSVSFVRSYEPMTVMTQSGDELSGVLRSDGVEEVVLATGPTSEVKIPRSEVVEMRPGTISVMPQGLHQQLSRQELADLIAFLKGAK